MARKRTNKKQSTKERESPKGTAEILYEWSEKHGYWKTLLAVVVVIFAYFLAKYLLPS